MIRIIGTQKSEQPDKEFVLMQNQGSLRVQLRGHMLISDETISTQNLALGAHLFGEEVLIPAGMYVMLMTGCGTPKWTKSKDGALIYTTYGNRPTPIWTGAESLHILSVNHSFSERRDPLISMR